MMNYDTAHDPVMHAFEIPIQEGRECVAREAGEMFTI